MSLLPQYKITNHRADAPETTEWEDIFHKKFEGTHANEVHQKLVEAEYAEQVSKIRTDRLEQNIAHDLSSNSSSFSDFLDEEDKVFFEQERQKRKDIITQLRSQKRFGQIKRISRQDYVSEVEENVNILVYIDSEHLRECKLINALLNEVAQRFIHLKILVIDFQQASSGMPEAAVPMLVYYKQGAEKPEKIAVQSGLAQIGGWNLKVEDIIVILSKKGMIEAQFDDQENAPTIEKIMMRGIKGEKDWK
ncbi:Thioredoxin-like family protein [Spironucleus salmonicida]|uniref:Phosducin-like family protein n=1 Tax=Spironucleus salmonicida TaxID=348837 RepID=V6LB42_9EUKA|nr:Thioredoxin-like family protein [Spironucleus salmonicida]|eukprot:EST41453.1 Phosducin-like family protein [Spironucleus salmonicida]